MSIPNFTAEDIKVGEIYRVKNDSGNILTRKVLEIDFPKKGMLRVERQNEDEVTIVHTHIFVKVVRLMGITKGI